MHVASRMSQYSLASGECSVSGNEAGYHIGVRLMVGLSRVLVKSVLLVVLSITVSHPAYDTATGRVQGPGFVLTTH